MGRTIAWATLVAGTLDILFAIVLTHISGHEPALMLRRVASGLSPAGSEGAAGPVLGLLVHFTLMAIMAMVFVVAAHDRPALTAKPFQWGIVYGLVTYFIMNWMILPLRFDAAPLPPKPLSIATQLFAHIFLVGIPIALIAARHLRQAAR